MSKATKTWTLRGTDNQRRVLSIEHDYIWVGTEEWCFGHISGKALTSIMRRLAKVRGYVVYKKPVGVLSRKEGT